MPSQIHDPQPQQVTYQSSSHPSPLSRSLPCTDLSPPRDWCSGLPLHQMKMMHQAWSGWQPHPIHCIRTPHWETSLPWSLFCSTPIAALVSLIPLSPSWALCCINGPTAIDHHQLPHSLSNGSSPWEQGNVSASQLTSGVRLLFFVGAILCIVGV